MAVIENGDKAILNVNDCPYVLSQKVLDRVLSDFSKIDLLLVGYAGAGSYPQCWQNYTDESKLKIHGIKKKNHFLNMGLDFLKRIKPISYMPFAGTYTLKGKRANLERYRVVPELQDALKFYQDNYDGNGFLLNSEQSFDLETKKTSAEYIPTKYEEKIKYVEEVLSKFKYDYEDDPPSSLNEIVNLIPKCFERYEDKRKEIKFESDTSVLLKLPENNYCKISCNGKGFKILNQEEFDLSLLDPHVIYELDFKLLKRILSGPRYAHWNNAEVGSHIMFSRNPDVYERGLYYSMNYFHL
jgi:UDP-MurNAc hydroxylase